MLPRPKITDSRKPDKFFSNWNLNSSIFQDLDMRSFQRAADTCGIQPDVMISKYREHTISGLKTAEYRHHVFRCDKRSTDDSLNNKVTQDKNQIGCRSIC